MSIPVSVFYCQLSRSDEPEVFERLLRTLPEQVKRSIHQYAHAHDRHLRITGKALLRYGLRSLDPSNTQALEHYSHPEGSKPFLERSAFRFSISHSGNVALCAITEASVIGADVEEIARTEPELLQPYFNGEQWQKILQAMDIEDELYRQWTIKEAALKAWGIPIGEADLREMQIESGVVRFAGHSLQYAVPELIPAYKICIASEQSPDHITHYHVALAQLE